jgi:hypothetical protein
MRFYLHNALIKTHPRKARGERSIDPGDFPDEKRPYAMRDIAYLQGQATACGPAVGRFAAALLAGPLPWTRMRRVEPGDLHPQLTPPIADPQGEIS